MRLHAFERIRDTGIVAILRGVEKEQLEPVLEALYSGGVRCVEITLNTPGSLRMIERAGALYGTRMEIGAGTVLEEISARNAILAGASFVLAPTLDRKTIEMCSRYDCLAVPGAFTPTEVLSAWSAGAPLVKVFPCGSVGPAYIKDLQGPLPHIRTMPVGGVNLASAEAFFKAGAFALGVGSSLFDPKLAFEGKFDLLRDRARQFIAIAAERRAERKSACQP